MASIDKAGMVVVIAVLVIFLGVAAAMNAAQNAGPVASAPIVSKTVEPEAQVESDTSMEDAKAQAAADAKAQAAADAKAQAAADAKAQAAADAKAQAAAEPQTHTVEAPLGTSVPGCEETNACFSPADITINAGDTIDWVNVDTAAHTVTSGSPADGPSGVFDSSLLMADATYSFIFENAGSYDYFCMVHPWMIGSVTVE